MSDYKYSDRVLLDCGDSAIVRNDELLTSPDGEALIVVDRHHYGGGVTTSAVPLSSIRPAPNVLDTARRVNKKRTPPPGGKDETR